ncbi:MAG: H-NS histone family protein [Lysobacteraceae bacterium]
MAMDLDKMSPQQLQELITKAEKQKQKLHRNRIGEVRKAITAKAKAEGYTIEQLFGKGRKASTTTGTPVPAKYRNKADPSQTWSGRGKRPRWLADAIAKGKKLTDYAI